VKILIPTIVSFLILLFGITDTASIAFDESTIDTPLLLKAKTHQKLNFIVILKAQSNLSSSKIFQSKVDKAHYVFEDLRQMARQTQGAVIQLLKEEEVPYQSFYIVNAIQAEGNLALVRQLAVMPEVKVIIDNPWVKMEEPISHHAATLRGPIDAEWGIQKINADQVWEMGYKGQGVVIGGQDTGYDWEHPTLKEKYRGWDGTTADHNFNWHDAIREINPLHRDSTLEESNNPCGFSSPFPCDDGSHGTHTMGTMVGSDEDNQIGVAPEAKWIACRNMERGYGTPSSYIECFEWFLAPTDLNNENPDPSKAPHVINNSWSCPELEGCTAATFSLLQTAVSNLKSAGTVVVVSAGNSGVRGCESINTPSAIFEESFTIGATALSDTIAGFSSRGPVSVDASGRMKPNVVAPGVGVRSSTPNGEFKTFSGTSMSGPHVAGMVALMISANPSLAGQVDKIEDIIERTAVPLEAEISCNADPAVVIPNGTYGFGRVDVLKAVDQLLSSPELSSFGQVEFFPNPFVEGINLKTTNINGDAMLEIFNVSGQRLKMIELSLVNSAVQTVSLQDLGQGVYFYRLSNEDNVLSGKLIKLR